jgi:hypothetical protein
VGSRSADLVTGLSSPLLCAPARRPAHLLGCSASPRLAACLAACVGAPLDSSLCTPSACTSGAGVPTRGTSPWGPPLRVERCMRLEARSSLQRTLHCLGGLVRSTCSSRHWCFSIYSMMALSWFRSSTASSNNAHCACNTPTPCVIYCMLRAPPHHAEGTASTTDPHRPTLSHTHYAYKACCAPTHTRTQHVQCTHTTCACRMHTRAQHTHSAYTHHLRQPGVAHWRDVRAVPHPCSRSPPQRQPNRLPCPY